MKKNYYFVLILLCCLGMGSCQEELEFLDEINDTPELRAGGDGVYDLLGYGYDATGYYMSPESSKLQVIDINALNAETNPISTNKLGVWSQTTYSGANSYEFTSSLSQSLNVSGVFKLFSGSVKHSFDSHEDYQEKYSIAMHNLIYVDRTVEFAPTVSVLSKYLTANFKNALAGKKYDEIISLYGTHVLRKIQLGARAEIMYRAISNSTNKSETVKNGAQVSYGKVFNADGSYSGSMTEALKNSDQKLKYRVIGGDGKLVTGMDEFTCNSGIFTNKVDLSRWKSSINNANVRLVGGDETSLIPIYLLVSDPTQQAALKNACEKYIAENQMTYDPTKKDPSKKMEIIIVERKNYGQHVNASVTLPDGYVLVGGGAQAYGPKGPTDIHPGAYLTASYPDKNLKTWHASSKDHKDAFSHNLTAYAIGLKIEGFTEAQLKKYISYTASTISASASHPQAKVTPPSGYTLIGGGAKVNYQTGGSNLLVKSMPNGNYWEVKSKDHQFSSPATIQAFAIGIQKTIPNFGTIEVKTIQQLTNIPNSNNTAELPLNYDWILTCPGAEAKYNDGGRMLTSLYPSLSMAFAGTKDAKWSDGGATIVYGIQIRKKY